MKALRWLLLLSVSLVLLLSAAACGGKKEDAKSPDAEQKLDDALALLPANAIAIGTVDGRAFFGSKTFGAELGKLLEKYIPLGPEAGFLLSRDVDRVTWGSYSYQGIDVAAVVIGRFDEAKIKQVASSNTPTKSGGLLVASQYAGRDVYTVSNVGFTLLSPTMAIAGTESGIRRVLERIKDKRVKRDLTPSMIQTIETPGAAAAVAADFATQPIPAEATRQMPMPWVQSLKAVRAVATFKDGVQIAGSMTYPEEAAAQTASQSVKQAANLSKWLAILGIRVQTFDVTVEKSDVQVKLAVDDASLRQLLAQAPQWLGQ
jgi:hypothetical protein